MAQAGYKIIGIAELGGGIYNKNGINIEALWEFFQTQRVPSTDSPALRRRRTPTF